MIKTMTLTLHGYIGPPLFEWYNLHVNNSNYMSVLLLVVLGFVILVSNIRSVTYVGSSNV